MEISLEKNDIFNVSAQNIDCGYTLEPPRRGTRTNRLGEAVLTSTHSLCFGKKKKKNMSVFPTKSQWKRIVSESVSSYEQSQWNIRVSSDNDFECFKITHTEVAVAGIYKITCVTDKNLIAHVARLWVMKPSIQRPCHLCNLVVRDILKHLVCDCDYTRPLVNWLLGNIHMNTVIDTFVEFAFCSKEALVTKMLTISLESEVSAEQYAFIANICFKTLKVITSGISLY